MGTKSKNKPKTFAEQLGNLFGSTKKSVGDTPNRGRAGKKSDEGASIAERINFGGRGEELKKKRNKRK